MKATLEFNLTPGDEDERLDHACALQGTRAMLAISDMFAYFRSRLKHEDLDDKTVSALEAAREKLCELVEEYKLTLE